MNVSTSWESSPHLLLLKQWGSGKDHEDISFVKFWILWLHFYEHYFFPPHVRSFVKVQVLNPLSSVYLKYYLFKSVPSLLYLRAPFYTKKTQLYLFWLLFFHISLKVLRIYSSPLGDYGGVRACGVGWCFYLGVKWWQDWAWLRVGIMLAWGGGVCPGLVPQLSQQQWWLQQQRWQQQQWQTLHFH